MQKRVLLWGPYGLIVLIYTGPLFAGGPEPCGCGSTGPFGHVGLA